MAYAELVDGEIQVRCDWTEKDLASQVPGMNYRSKTDRWHGPLAWSTCVIIQGIFGPRLEIGPCLLDWGRDVRSWIDAAMFWRDSVDPVDLCPRNGDSDDPYCKLYTYQRVGSSFLSLVPDGALLCDEMGVGKTAQVLVSLGTPHETLLPALVICPNSVKHQWADEAKRWCPEAIPYVIGGGAGKRRKLLEEVAQDPSALAVINYEAVRLHSRLAPYGSIRLIRCVECGGPDPDVQPSRCHKHPKELNRIPWAAVIADEAHRLKDPSANWTRAVWAVMQQPSVRRRWALTGTPIANHVGDLWSILRGVLPREFPAKTEFIERFALLAWNRHAALDIVGVRPDTRAEFDSIVMPRMRRMLKSRVLPHLPPKVRMLREAPMVPKQEKAYREMQEDMLTVLDSGDVVLSKTNLVKATRLLQFSSAYARVREDLTLEITEPSPKLDVLEEIIEELGEDRQLAVCALSRQLIELAAVRLDNHKPHPVSYRMLTGSVPEAQRPQQIQDFQSGNAQVMLFTIQAGGVGINLTAADTIVFLQRSWSMIENMQAEDRTHRIGSEKHECITVIDVIAPGTIEVRQIRKLQEKFTRLQDIVRDRERLMASGIDVDDLTTTELSTHLI